MGSNYRLWTAAGNDTAGEPASSNRSAACKQTALLHHRLVLESAGWRLFPPLPDKDLHVGDVLAGDIVGGSWAQHDVLGLDLDTLANRWQAEAVYRPRMDEPNRRRLEHWERALESVKRYHAAPNEET